jgi:hypothetical protein
MIGRCDGAGYKLDETLLSRDGDVVEQGVNAVRKSKIAARDGEFQQFGFGPRNFITTMPAFVTSLP